MTGIIAEQQVIRQSRSYTQEEFNKMQKVWWDTYVELHTHSPLGKSGIRRLHEIASQKLNDYRKAFPDEYVERVRNYRPDGTAQNPRPGVSVSI